MGGCQRHVWSIPALELCHGCRRAGMGEREEEEEGSDSSSSWAGDGAAPGSEHRLQDLGNTRQESELWSQHWRVRRERRQRRERCPPPLERWGWFWLLWLPGVQDGVPGRGKLCLWDFRLHKKVREVLGSWGSSARAGELWSLCLSPLYPSRFPQP